MNWHSKKKQSQRRFQYEKPLLYFLIVLVVLLQYPLWMGSGSIVRIWQLNRQIENQNKANTLLRERNRILEAEVQDLKKGLAAIEERARKELGMIKKGETFVHIVKRKKKLKQPRR